MQYEQRVVAFIDILGFGSIVDKTVDEAGKGIPDKIKELNDILEVARDVLDIDRPDKIFAKSKQITQFSDSIVISFLINEESEIYYTLLDILNLQIEFVVKGFVFRGGLTYGNLIHNDKVVFGPAMVQAYKLESKVAIYPRVIVDRSIIKIARQYCGSHHGPDFEEYYIKQILKKDSDDMYYLDYFNMAQGELNNPENDMPMYIEKLRAIIVPNLSSVISEQSVKYEWMKNKFNKLVRLYNSPKFIKNVTDPELREYYSSLEEIMD